VSIEEFETIYPETRNTIPDFGGEIMLSLNRCCVISGDEVRQDLGWNFRITSGRNTMVLSVEGAKRLHSALGQLLQKVLLEVS